MSTKKQYLTYRGSIKCLISDGDTLIFGTTHEEGLDTGVYFAEPSKGDLHHVEMPGAYAMVHDGKMLYVAGSDQHLYRGELKKKKLAIIGDAFDDMIVALACVSNSQLAVASGQTVTIVSRADASVHQVLTLDEPVASITTDKSGEWLVVGSVRGTMSVFEREDKPEFKLSSSKKIHEGAIYSLLFETDELRVLSTATDQKLQVTHARGELEPEDRGGKGMHNKYITAMIQGIEGRFYTTSYDSSVKAWPAGRTNRLPTTQKDGVVRSEHLALLQIGGKPHLATGCLDKSIRIYELDEEGKVGEIKVMLYGAMVWANHVLGSGDPVERQNVLTSLYNFQDAESLHLIADRISADKDHKLKVYATQLLGKSSHELAKKLLEGLLTFSVDDVSHAAYIGLRDQYGYESLYPLEKAIDSGHKVICVPAVTALGGLAQKNEKALEMLIQTLERDPQEARYEAFKQLERYYGSRKPDSALLALKSSRNDLVCSAIIRFYQLDLLGDERVEAAVRRQLESNNEKARRYAFWVNLTRSPKLVDILRSRDAETNRQIFELETAGLAEDKRKKGPPKQKAKEVKGLKEQDYAPLFEAMASRHLDTCLRGAMGLAVLQDTRAFGTLLQLSRENNADARVQTAQALEKLGDLRSLKRLRMMIRDDQSSVRDAAFSALTKLEKDDPLTTARAGLSAAHEDVRQRGLEVLSRMMRKKTPVEGALELLGRTLNDPIPNVRSEAFKVCLNKDVFENSEDALRFANESIFDDVREKILIEVTAQHQEDWAWNMLLEFMNDSSQRLRKEAFETALSKAKKERRIQSLSSALESRYTDVRMYAVNELLTRRLEDVEDLLIKALDDDDQSVRSTAIRALITASARQLLAQAMTSSKHVDVQVQAARACARYGDERALKTLTDIVNAEEPNAKDNKGQHDLWLRHLEQALEGLAELGDPGAQDAIIPHIESTHSSVRQAAVRALVWTSRQDALGTLREVIKHQDKAVQKEAALGLAYWGDSLGSSIVFTNATSQNEQILASLGLFAGAEEHLYSFLDSSDRALRKRVFVILMLLELSEGDLVPDKCLAAISSAFADVRLRAAHGIERFSDSERFAEFVLENLNTQVGQNINPYSLSQELMEDLSRALSLGSTPVRIRAARLCETLFGFNEDKFMLEWKTFHERFEDELKELKEKQEEFRKNNQAETADSGTLSRAWSYLKELAKKATGSASEEFEDALRRLAFGAYVGLSREGSSETIKSGAIRGMHTLCKHDDSFIFETQRVLLLALGDSQQPVRALAMSTLQELEMAVKPLATEALATGYSDMGSAGLVLLAEQVSAAEGEALLQETMLTKTDGLEFEAMKLLQARHGTTSVWSGALSSVSQNLRTSALNELLSLWATEQDARDALSTVALKSKYKDVRISAADNLAYRTDLPEDTKGLIFDVLAGEKLQEGSYEQRSASSAMIVLDPEKAAPLLLDRIDQDEAENADVRVLIAAAGQTRQVSIIDRLYGYIEADKQRDAAFDAATMISGHDQYIQDPDDKHPESRDEWMKSQFTRHDEILRRLLELAYQVVDARRVLNLLNPAKWSLTDAVDDIFPTLLTFSDESVQEKVTEVVGWRARKRGGSTDLLKKALTTGTPRVQFLAAEGLALAGQKDGMSVLMTAVNFMESYDDRRRAVFALGELADPTALELLLGLVQDEESDLRPAAAQALGHLSNSERGDQIFKMLLGFAKSDHSDLSRSALTGLRHFNTPDAWRVIRSHAEDEYSWWRRETVAQLLGEYNDPANIELLRQMLFNDDDYDVIRAAAESLKKLYGPDSLEPDYIFVQAGQLWIEPAEGAVARLCERGEVSRLLELLAKVSFGSAERDVVQPLVNALLSREPLPVDEVVDKLADDNVRTALIAIQIVGRAGKAVAKKHGAKLKAAMQTTHDLWIENYSLMLSNQSRYQQAFYDVNKRYVLLCWACGQLEVGFDELVKVIDLIDVQASVDVKQAALLSMAMPWTGKKGVEYIAKLVTHKNATLRSIASAALQELDKSQAKALLDQSLEDAVIFSRLMMSVKPEAVNALLREHAQSIHLQGVVIGYLAQQGDETGLLKILDSQELTDEIRHGAIDGLASMATQTAIDALAKLGKDEDEDEDLRKAAWRARRRAIRSQQSEVSA